MPFKIVFKAAKSGEFVIHDETQLCGLDFLNMATTLLRQDINSATIQEHRMLGDRVYYCVTISDDTAEASGKFASTDNVTVTVPDNWLKPYIFYSADRRSGRDAKAYPFVYNDAVVITSHIDEVKLVEEWVELNCPTDIEFAEPLL